jgi:hypothetical protein
MGDGGEIGKDFCEVRRLVHLTFLRGMQHRHWDFTGMGPRLRLGTNVALAGDDHTRWLRAARLFSTGSR